MNQERFRQELIRRQGATRGKEFAHRLGISESYWSLIRRGERPLTLVVIQRAVTEFPDLAPYVVKDLLAENQAQAQREYWLIPKPEPRRLSVKRWLVNGAVAALLLVGVVLAESGSLSTAPNPILAAEQQATKTPAPTKTPVATRTPTPTREERDGGRDGRRTPTATPTKAGDPTATPTPTATSGTGQGVADLCKEVDDDGKCKDDARKAKKRGPDDPENCPGDQTTVIVKGKPQCVKINDDPPLGDEDLDFGEPGQDGGDTSPEPGHDSQRVQRKKR